MRPTDAFRLVILSAIWGFSFLFMRVLSPVLGAILTADLRLLIAGVALLTWLAVRRQPLFWRAHWRHYAVVGFLGAAVPFLCFTFSARHIPAAYSAILNASSPLFAALAAAVWLRAPFSRQTLAGLVLGIGGVALVANVRPSNTDEYYTLSIFACLLASLGYALSGVYIKKHASKVPPYAIAAGNQVLAGLMVAVLLPWNPPVGGVTGLIVFYTLALALLCSAVAYYLYYQLVADIGPTRALTVTFLVPMFGMLWAWLFLAEPVTGTMLAGCALVIAGTWCMRR